MEVGRPKAEPRSLSSTVLRALHQASRSAWTARVASQCLACSTLQAERSRLPSTERARRPFTSRARTDKRGNSPPPKIAFSPRRQAHAEARRLLAAALERIPPQLEAPQDAPESPEITTPRKIPRKRWSPRDRGL